MLDAESSDDDDDEDLARVVAEVKAAERPGAGDWAAAGLAETWWPAFLRGLPPAGASSSDRCCCRDSTRDGIAREDGRALSRERFGREYEAASRPCLVTAAGVAQEAHADTTTWRLAGLRATYGSWNFRVSDTHGAVIGLDEWCAYGATTRDDAPFSLYDSEIFDDAPALRAAYEPPAFVAPCAFAPFCRAQTDAPPRPPYRWLLLGAPRSGTGLHVDPLATHAWVYLCEGRKLWLMRPPEERRRDHRDGDVVTDEPQTPSAEWLASRDGAAFRAAPDCVEFVQEPGQLVYVPAGWRHAVLNLDWTVAITENYCADLGELGVMPALRRDAPALYAKIRRVGALARVLIERRWRLLERALLPWLAPSDKAAFLAAVGS